MSEGATGRALVPKLSSLSRFTFVDVVLWALRIGVVFVVVAGSVGALLKGRYGAVQ
jgi:branched-chain amino acid transport system permease protein